MEVAETFVIWSQTFWTISRRNDRNRSREVLEGMVTACLKKSPASSFAIADLMYEVAGFITTSSKEYAENDTFPPPSSCPSCPSLLSIPSFPSSLVLFLACTVCIPSFYNFLFSLTARQIASRSMNFLERSCDCLPMFPFFFSFFSPLRFFLSFSSWIHAMLDIRVERHRRKIVPSATHARVRVFHATKNSRAPHTVAHESIRTLIFREPIIYDIRKKNSSKVHVISSVVRFNYYDCIGKVWDKENIYRNYKIFSRNYVYYISFTRYIIR